MKKYLKEQEKLTALRYNTNDRVLQNALMRALGETPTFSEGDKVVVCDNELSMFGVKATVKRVYHTKAGVRYAIVIDETIGMEVSDFSGDDLELYE